MPSCPRYSLWAEWRLTNADIPGILTNIQLSIIAMVATLQTRTTFTVFALMVLIGFLVVGFVSSISMPLLVESSSQMMNCPFAYGEQSMCPMSLTDHFSVWRKFWLAITPGQISAVTFMVLAFVAGLLATTMRKRFGISTRPWSYHWRFSYQPITYFTELYSDGIIQPRLYA